MRYILPHEQLHAYRHAQQFAAVAVPLLDCWASKIAVRGQLDRAIESVMTNLVKAARRQRTDKGIYLLECSFGSVLECAACFDVALLRGLIDDAQVQAGKQILQRVARMEVGLRNSWSGAMSVAEEGDCYARETAPCFDHETLNVYQRSLQLHEALGPILFGERKDHRYVRRIDELSTSITLNVAEGNGRFSPQDHGKFADAAEDAGAGLAAYLDLVQTGWNADTDSAKSLLREIMAMLGGLTDYLQESR